MHDLDVLRFRVAFDPRAVDELRTRLTATKWPERETVDDWSQGVPLAVVRDLASYWADQFDFAAAEQRLNAWPQFTTLIDDLAIHFVHARSREPDAIPLVVTHGWPGSFVEFFDVIGPLTDPVAHGGLAADAFHVVCPSMPGYGFSDRPTTRGRGLAWIADAWVTLMARLGYVSVYWFTGTGASSARLYWESAGPAAAHDPAMAALMSPVTVPTGCSIFPKEIRRPSRRWAEQRFTNIHWWNEPERGGHFAAFEQPNLFVDEVRSSFRPLR